MMVLSGQWKVTSGQCEAVIMGHGQHTLVKQEVSVCGGQCEVVSVRWLV